MLTMDIDCLYLYYEETLLALEDRKQKMLANKNQSAEEVRGLFRNAIESLVTQYNLAILTAAEGAMRHDYMLCIQNHRMERSVDEEFHRNRIPKEQVKFWDHIYQVWKDKEPTLIEKFEEFEKYWNYRHHLAHGGSDMVGEYISVKVGELYKVVNDLLVALDLKDEAQKPNQMCFL